MEEDPKDHNFDRRLDGPMQEPSSATTTTRRPSQHLHHAASDPNDTARTKHLPLSSIGQVRKSLQVMRSPSDAVKLPPGRASTSMSRVSRPSRDFDTRRDGPYGRPSLTTTRRRTSEQSLNPSLGPEQGCAAPPVREAGEKQDEIPGDQAARTLEAFHSSTEAAFEPEPPPLNYLLWPRRWRILFFWSLIVLDCIGMPLGLYFGLRYHTSLSDNTVFSIVTAALGGVSIVEYVLRFWRLFRHNSTCRVIGARRMYLDWFHWNFSFGWFIIMIELIVGTVQVHPPIRLLSMPVASMMFAFGTELLLVDILRYFEIPAPVRMSSIPRGSQLRPGIYSIIEDVCAADGGGGTEYREALNRRYEASHLFRAMLRRLGLFWSIGAEGMAVLTTILVFTLPGNAAFCVGWSAPFVWAALWTLCTVWYVKRELALEKMAWAEEVAVKSSA